MANTSFIRTLYQPVQPAENMAGKGKLYYKEYMPGLLLQPYIHCFWELKTREPLQETYPYRVVADGCIDLIIDTYQYNGILVAGIADSAFDIPMTDTIAYFGIRFLPGCAGHFLRMEANSIANQMTAAENILDKEINTLASLIFERKTMSAKLDAAEKFLLSRLARLNASLHPGLASALHYILTGNGNQLVDTHSAGWISPRQLRRLFHEHIGCSPKLFSRIVRFQQTLRTLHRKHPDQLSIFYDHGYFDQSHFIKEFKTFYGTVPSLATP